MLSYVHSDSDESLSAQCQPSSIVTSALECSAVIFTPLRVKEHKAVGCVCVCGGGGGTCVMCPPPPPPTSGEKCQIFLLSFSVRLSGGGRMRGGFLQKTYFTFLSVLRFPDWLRSAVMRGLGNRCWSERRHLFAEQSSLPFHSMSP